MKKKSKPWICPFCGQDDFKWWWRFGETRICEFCIEKILLWAITKIKEKQ